MTWRGLSSRLSRESSRLSVGRTSRSARDLQVALSRTLRALSLLLLAAQLQAATYYLTFTGLPGEREYEIRFSMVAGEIDHALKAAGPDAHVTTLRNATKDQVRTALAQISKEANPDDGLVVMIIGHGSFDGVEYKINLKGPDLTAGELAGLMDRVPSTRQLVVNMTSSSGASIDSLRKPNRIVITATKSGTEKNATIFAKYWAEALTDPAADTDKNEIVSALEAFKFAEQKTAGYYETSKRLATEHPVLEDTGKGEGVKSPSPENGEGLLAGRFPLVRHGALASAATDPKKRELVTKREQLEQQIDQLKYQKAALPETVYKKQLAALLLQLAQTQEELDK